MRQQVPTWLAVLVIVLVIVIAGVVYWRLVGSPRTPVETEKLPATHQPAPLPTGGMPSEGTHQPAPVYGR